jgi:2-keto-4-pentenoate hydratase/2-oxohepta-3-ene-1,7-dioic acid hydratase in catechol pathway
VALERFHTLWQERFGRSEPAKVICVGLNYHDYATESFDSLLPGPAGHRRSRRARRRLAPPDRPARERRGFAGLLDGAADFGVPAIVAHASTVFTLEPGDLILTGTPAGVGIFRDPPVALTDGDEVEVVLEGIGTLGNPVIAEQG